MTDSVHTDPDELRRVAAVEQTGLLDTGFESVYDDITELAAEICQTSAAYIALVDSARQWFKSVRGLPCRETTRSGSICAYTVRLNQPVVVPDTKEDARFHNSPVVRGFGIRFYTGIPIRNREGLALGSLCVVDFVPRTLTEAQNRALRTLAQQVETQIALREQVAMLEAAELQQKQLAAALAASEAHLRSANAELQSLTLTDPLTTVGNRRALDLSLEQHAAVARLGKVPLAMLMVDVDHFKQLNDAFGHAFGDVVLRRIGEVLRAVVRRVDSVHRFGGEEFTVLLPEADLLQAEAIGERIRREIEAINFAPAHVTVSVGVAVWDSALSESADLVQLADSALYQAKSAGRNRVATAAAA